MLSIIGPTNSLGYNLLRPNKPYKRCIASRMWLRGIDFSFLFFVGGRHWLLTANASMCVAARERHSPLHPFGRSKPLLRPPLRFGPCTAAIARGKREREREEKKAIRAKSKGGDVRGERRWRAMSHNEDDACVGQIYHRRDSGGKRRGWRWIVMFDNWGME